MRNDNSVLKWHEDQIQWFFTFRTLTSASHEGVNKYIMHNYTEKCGTECACCVNMPLDIYNTSDRKIPVRFLKVMQQFRLQLKHT